MRWLSQLLIALIVCLVAITLPAAPAQANGASMFLSPGSGVPGEEITVYGYNFTAGEWVEIYYDDVFMDDIRAGDDDGDFRISFTIPESRKGDHEVRAEDEEDITAYDYFTVKPGLTIDTEEGPVGSNVTVEGHGFAGEDEGDIEMRYYLAGTSDVVARNIEANEDGWWRKSFEIPSSAMGSHKIDAEGDDSNFAHVRDVYFDVTPSISLDKLSGSAGENIIVTGNGFYAQDRYIKILFDGTEVETEIIRADENGYWQESFEVPEMPNGDYGVTSEGEVTQQEDISPLTFTIGPGVVLLPDEGHVGTNLTVIGHGFVTDGDVVIKYDGSQEATATTDDKGSFEVSFLVPESQHGGRPVTAADAAGNNATAIFTMESAPPGAPELISPPDGERVGFIGTFRPTFEWSEVSDPSDVRYNLQIATTANVTSSGFANPKVSIADIVGTNRTLDKKDALPYGTYYWIVQAVDRAGNAGNWSEVYSFHAGVLPLWASILIIVAAVAAIGTLVYFFIIRRRIYYY